MANDNEDLEINITGDASGVTGSSRAAEAAIRKVTQEANSLDRAFRNLRGALDPMYAAQDRYNESLAQASRLLAAGRISETEYAASVEAATKALSSQAAAQLRGTEVANRAAAATKAASRARVDAEAAANNVVVAQAKTTATAVAAEEARLTALTALEAKKRAATAVEEARNKLETARKAEADLAVSRPRDPSTGRFVAAAPVAASRAADTAEAQEQLRSAQLDAVAANQKSRNAERVANTREESARRAVVAERSAAAASQTAADISAKAQATAAEAVAALTTAQEVAAAAAVKSAEEQVAAELLVKEATEARAKAALDAAVAEETEAKAAANLAAAEKKAAAETAKAEIAARRAAVAEAQRVAAANRIKAALDPAYAAQQKYNQAVTTAASLAASGHIDEPTRIKAVALAQKELEEALKHGTGATINNRIATEGLVLIHEGLQRRFSRMAGSMMIMVQALAGQSAVASALAFALSPVGIAIIGITAAIGGAIISTALYAEEQRKLTISTLGLGAASGVTSEQINKMATSHLNLKSSVGDNIASLSAYTQAGVRVQSALQDLSRTTDDFASLTGMKTKDAVKELAAAMRDPTKGAEDLNAKLSFLDATQLQEIETLQNLGEKYKAQALLAKELKENDDQAAQASGGLQGALHQLGVVFSDLNNWVGSVNDNLLIFEARVGGLGGKIDAARKAAAEAQKIKQEKQDSAAGLPLEQETGEGKQRIEAEKAAGHVTTLNRALEAEIKLHGKNSEQANTARQALAEYSDTLARVTLVDKTYHNELQRQTGLLLLQTQLVKAKHAHNRQEADDIGAQIFALKHYNELASDKDLHAAEAAAGGLAGAKVRDKGGGPSQVALWAEELHQREIDSKDFFKDETDDELTYWQGKLALTKVKSKEWVEVNAKIYELQKKNAKDAYAEDIADLKEKVAAAKGDLAEEQKAWDAYLFKVRTVMGIVSKEAIDATKEYIKAQQEMAEERVKISDKSEKAAEGPVTRQHEAAQTSLQSQEETVSFHEKGGEDPTKAAEQKRAILAQEIAEEQNFENTIYQMKMDELQKELDIPGRSADKIRETHEKIEAETQSHLDKLQTMGDRALLEQQRANEDVASTITAKWKTVIDGMTNTMASATTQWIEHGITFKQFMTQIAENLIQTWVSMGYRMLNNWIMTMIQKQVVTHTTNAAETASTIASQAAQTGAVAAGTATRVGITAAGAAQEKSINLITALKVIGMNAAKAASGAYSALAGIPIIGPILGAAAAVATFAAVLAFGTLISAAGGQDQVPYNGQLTKLHEDEMVLSAKYATPLRKMLTTRNSDNMIQGTSQVGEAARVSNNTDNSTGGTNFHYNPVINHHDVSWEKLVAKDGSNMRRWVGNQVRNGVKFA